MSQLTTMNKYAIHKVAEFFVNDHISTNFFVNVRAYTVIIMVRLTNNGRPRRPDRLTQGWNLKASWTWEQFWRGPGPFWSSGMRPTWSAWVTRVLLVHERQIMFCSFGGTSFVSSPNVACLQPLFWIPAGAWCNWISTIQMPRRSYFACSRGSYFCGNCKLKLGFTSPRTPQISSRCACKKKDHLTTRLQVHAWRVRATNLISVSG